MFCNNCGNKLNEGAKFCPSCGSAVSNNQNTVVNNNQVNAQNINQGTLPNEFVNKSEMQVESKANVIFVIASFLFPILGLIFFVKDKDSNPKNSKACGIAGISGFALNMILVILSTLIGVFTVLNGVNYEEGSSNGTTNYPSTTKSLPTKTTEKVEEKNEQGETPASLSDDWKTYTVLFNNKKITLPCSYSDFSSITGFTMKNDLASSSLPKNRYGLANVYKNDLLAANLEILNTTDSEILYKDGNVARISQSTYQVVNNKAEKFVFPGSLTIGMSITDDELKQKFGEPYKKRDFDATNYLLTTYQYVADESWTSYNYYEITLKDGVIDELRLDHKGN